MLFGGALPGKTVETRILRQEGETAEVRTDEDGGRTYRVVREGSRWRIDLDLPD